MASVRAHQSCFGLYFLRHAVVPNQLSSSCPLVAGFATTSLEQRCRQVSLDRDTDSWNMLEHHARRGSCKRMHGLRCLDQRKGCRLDYSWHPLSQGSMRSHELWPRRGPAYLGLQYLRFGTLSPEPESPKNPEWPEWLCGRGTE